MGGFKKVIKRAPYKERSAPKARKNLGLLEKHKDYSLRAASFNKKKTQLRSLQALAADRNPDEFHHHMLSARRRGPSSSLSALVRSNAGAEKGSSSKRWDGTVSGDRGNRALDVDAVRLLKTQDMGYVRTVRNVAQRDVDRLRQRLVVAGAMLGTDAPEDERDGGGDGSASGSEFDFGFDEEDEEDDDDVTQANGGRTPHHKPAQTKPRKIVFVDDAEARDEQVVRAEGQQLGSDEESGEEEDAKTSLEIRKLHFQRLRRRLETAESKLKALTMAEHEMEQQRARMGKTPTKGVVTKKGKKMKVTLRKR